MNDVEMGTGLGEWVDTYIKDPIESSHPMRLTYAQKKMSASDNPNKLAICPRRSGKSTWAMLEALRSISSRPDYEVYVVFPDMTKLQGFHDGLRRILTHSSLPVELVADHQTHHPQVLVFSNGSRIRLYTLPASKQASRKPVFITWQPDRVFVVAAEFISKQDWNDIVASANGAPITAVSSMHETSYVAYLFLSDDPDYQHFERVCT